jgi:hypothetical protein
LTDPRERAAGDVALGEEEDDRRRDRAEDRTCGERSPVLLELPGDELVQADRKRLHVGVVALHGPRDEVVVAVATYESMPTTAMIGVTSGRMRGTKVRACPAPSTLADSSMSRGTVSKKPFMSLVFTPSAAEVDQDEAGQGAETDRGEVLLERQQQREDR